MASAASAQQAIELPGIVVQGATLSPPPAPKATPAPSSATTGAAPVTADEPAAGSITGDATFDAATRDRVGGYPTSAVGSSVTVVTGEELRRQQVRHAGDALRSLPGIAVSRGGGFGAQTQLRIRGAEANHTLVLIDGVVANDTNNGAFDFSDLSTDNIERIEVIRGPQSGIYGSNALAGVVNIITKGGRGPLELTARTEAGSFNTFDYALRASGGNERAWGSIAYHERHTQGFDIAPFGSERDGATLKTFNLKGGVRIADGLVLDFVLRHSDKTGDRDTEGGPVGTLAVQVDDPTRFGSQVTLGGVNLRWDTLDGHVTHVIRTSRNESRLYDIAPSFTTRNTSETLRAGYLGTVRFDTPALVPVSHALTVLAERELENFTPQSDFADSVTRDRSRLATALEYRTEIARRLTLTGNVRRDDNDTFGDFNTWRLAASLRLSEVGLRPHASVGTGVKLPTMFETFGLIPGFFTPNPDLLPEESKGFDAGIEWTFWSGRAVLDVTYFEQDLRNRIDGFAPGPGFTFTAVNRPGISTRDGVELSGRVALTPSLTLAGAYTFLTAETAAGEREVRRPRNTARADLTYLFANARGTLTLSALYNGAMDDTAFRIDGYVFGSPLTTPVRTTLDDYWLVNVAATYKLIPGVEIFGRVENILNEHYYEIYGFETPGIAGFAGVKLTFGGESEVSPLTARR